MNHRIIATYVFILGFFGFLAYAYVNYHHHNEPKTSLEKAEHKNYVAKEEVEEIVKNVIKENGKLMMDVLVEYQHKKAKDDLAEVQKKIADKQTAIENNVNNPRVGALGSKLKVVEFFDYNCGYCKKMLEVKNKALHDNSDVEYVFIDLPVLGENSLLKSKYSLAVFHTDNSKYLDFHNKLLSQPGGISEEQIIELVIALGLDVEKVKALAHDRKITDIIAANAEIAREIGVRGTPAFIISGELFPGFLNHEQFTQHLSAGRGKLGLPTPAAPVAIPAPEAAQEPAAPSESVDKKPEDKQQTATDASTAETKPADAAEKADS